MEARQVGPSCRASRIWASALGWHREEGGQKAEAGMSCAQLRGFTGGNIGGSRWGHGLGILVARQTAAHHASGPAHEFSGDTGPQSGKHLTMARAKTTTGNALGQSFKHLKSPWV